MEILMSTLLMINCSRLNDAGEELKSKKQRERKPKEEQPEVPKEETDEKEENDEKSESEEIKKGIPKVEDLNDDIHLREGMVRLIGLINQFKDKKEVDQMSLNELDTFERLMFAGVRRIHKAKEYLRVADSTDNNNKSSSKRAHFGTVEVREYENTLGGGVPAEGLPLGLSWKVIKTKKNQIDSFELGRQPERVPREEFMAKGFIPSKERTKLIRSIGHSKDSMERELMDVWVIRRNRNESNMGLKKGYTSDES